MLWVKDTPRTLEWALEKEAASQTSDQRRKSNAAATPNLIEVQNGEITFLG